MRRTWLACISAAEHRGLDILDAATLIHVSAAPNAPISAQAGLRIHRSRPLAPPGESLESVPDMLRHVAHCLPRLDALVIWESAIHEQCITLGALRRIPWRGPAERGLARDVTGKCDSVLETVLLFRLREAGIPVRQQVSLLGHRVDFLIGDDLVIQADGFKFHTGKQRSEDIRHDLLLELEGMRVIRLSYAQVVHEWPETLELLRVAIAQTLR